MGILCELRQTWASEVLICSDSFWSILGCVPYVTGRTACSNVRTSSQSVVGSPQKTLITAALYMLPCGAAASRHPSQYSTVWHVWIPHTGHAKRGIMRAHNDPCRSCLKFGHAACWSWQLTSRYPKCLPQFLVERNLLFSTSPRSLRLTISIANSESARSLARQNQLFLNRKNGFVGTCSSFRPKQYRFFLKPRWTRNEMLVRQKKN